MIHKRRQKGKKNRQILKMQNKYFDLLSFVCVGQNEFTSIACH